MSFKEINVESFKLAPFAEFKNEWALVTSGNEKRLNTMTISWGGLGVIWQKPVSFIFIRPQRYTFEFLEKNDCYSLSFLEEGHRDILGVCGSKSGRDINKINETGLIPIFDKESPYFEQSRLVFICKKIYGQFIDPSYFIDKKIHSEYKNHDYHKMFIGEIARCLVKYENE